MRGHYTNSYTTNFDVTRAKMLEYVTRSDDFSPEEADKIAEQLWQGLHDFMDQTNLPPLVPYVSSEPTPQFSYRATDVSIFLMAIILATPPLFLVSWLLARLAGRPLSSQPNT
jgi:hypothetical protein